MTVVRVFTHEFNPVEVAIQEWKLSWEGYREACRNFDSTDPRKVAAFIAARERRTKSWNCYWEQTGY